ncbi:MAG: hypothetical protein J5608_00715 [Alphaproteobacteria bacterium]|nr:hypothetical protein [Alphaproteobacteria bacterium]
MSKKFNNFCAQAKDPVIILGMTVIACLLVFKTCGGNKKGYSDRELLEEIATNVETIKQDAGNIKADTKNIRHVVNKTDKTVTRTADKVENIEKIVTRTEKKVDAVQETADEILATVQECCDCCGNEIDTVAKPQPKPVVIDTVAKPKPAPIVVKPAPVVVNPAPAVRDTNSGRTSVTVRVNSEPVVDVQVDAPESSTVIVVPVTVTPCETTVQEPIITPQRIARAHCERVFRD